MTKKHKILVVDDEPEITRSLKIGLEGEGFEVDVYNDPSKALSNFSAGVYALTIIDVRIPSMNSFDLYRRMKELDKNIKVCFYSAYEVYEKAFHTLFPELQSDCFLRKPAPIYEVARVIKRIIEREEGAN